MEPWVVALISAVASGSVSVIGAVYWFGRNSVTTADMHELRDLAVLHRDQLKEEIARERREVGEGLHAIRERINRVELESSQTYVRGDSWHQAMNQMQETIGKSDQADHQWRLRIEEKLDRLAERISEIPMRT